jgi:hypothetical protein
MWRQARDRTAAGDGLAVAHLGLTHANLLLEHNRPADALVAADRARQASTGSQVETLAMAYAARALVRLAAPARTVQSQIESARGAVERHDLPDVGAPGVGVTNRVEVGAALLEALSWLPNSTDQALGFAEDVLPAADRYHLAPGPARLSLACALAPDEPEHAATKAVEGLTLCAALGPVSRPARKRLSRTEAGIPDRFVRRQLVTDIRHVLHVAVPAVGGVGARSAEDETNA